MDTKDRDKLEKELRNSYNQAGSDFKDKVEKLLWKDGYMDVNNIPWSMWGEYQGDLDELFGPTLTKAFLLHAQQMAHTVPMEFSWDLMNEYARNWSRDYTYDLVKGITNTDRQLLQSTISQYWETGMSLEDARRLIEQSPAFGPARADMIATTEITRSSVQGELWVVDEVEKYGFPMVSIWKTNVDELVCPICGPRNQTERGKGWEVPPPAHPRCRCWLNHVPAQDRIEQPAQVVPDIPTQLPELVDEWSKPLPTPDKVTEMGLKKYIQSLYPDIPVDKNRKYVFNEAMEKKVAQELYDLKRSGFPEEYLPEKFRFGYKGDFEGHLDGAIGMYWHKTKMIYYNTKEKLWDPDALRQLVDLKFWATNNTSSHELTHRAHYVFWEKLSKERMDRLFPQYMPRMGLSPEEGALIGQQVSLYASSNNYEAVAETMSGLLNGNKYGPEVIRIYKKFGGPPVPGYIEYTEDELETLVRALGDYYLDETPGTVGDLFPD